MSHPGYQPKHTHERYLQEDPFGGDMDVDIRCQTTKIVKIRKEQTCFGLYGREEHKIQPGALTYCERALVDGKWGSCYTCLECMDRYIKEHYDE